MRGSAITPYFSWSRRGLALSRIWRLDQKRFGRPKGTRFSVCGREGSNGRRTMASLGTSGLRAEFYVLAKTTDNR